MKYLANLFQITMLASIVLLPARPALAESGPGDQGGSGQNSATDDLLINSSKHLKSRVHRNRLPTATFMDIKLRPDEALLVVKGKVPELFQLSSLSIHLCQSKDHNRPDLFGCSLGQAANLFINEPTVLKEGLYQIELMGISQFIYLSAGDRKVVGTQRLNLSSMSRYDDVQISQNSSDSTWRTQFISYHLGFDQSAEFKNGICIQKHILNQPLVSEICHAVVAGDANRFLELTTKTVGGKFMTLDFYISEAGELASEWTEAGMSLEGIEGLEFAPVFSGSYLATFSKVINGREFKSKKAFHVRK